MTLAAHLMGAGGAAGNVHVSWGASSLIMGSMVAVLIVAMVVLERIDMRIELNRWLRQVREDGEGDRPIRRG